MARSGNHSEQRDFVDLMLGEIHSQYPDRDTRAMAAVSRIQRAAFLIEAGMSRTAAKAGLNLREMLLLAALRRAGPSFSLNPAQLLKECFAPSATLTRQVDHLTALGLVERKPDLTDRRSVLVHLTRQGRKLFDSIVTLGVLLEEPELQAANGLTSAEIDALNRILHKLLRLQEVEGSRRAAKQSAAPRKERATKTVSS
ncbi:MAG TPA: MarR family transcriptional regulator [Candidatus Binataceae bacterium]|nr:MarR family transcriptional regulator [Candidatus Binataceae bacterium]